jgi:PIN domain nuclease of toxin-antitoxin system
MVTKMATKHVVDTHALVWFLEGNPRLGANAKAILEDADSELIVPVIALAEACWIIEHGRTSIRTVSDFLTAIDADPRITLVPLDRAVLDKTLDVVAIEEMHDRQIVATALLLVDKGETAVVLTKDDNIHRCGLVPIVW